MLIPRHHLITPTSPEVRSRHELDLKVSQVMCSYGGKPLPKARKYQFYMNTDTFLSANPPGLHL